MKRILFNSILLICLFSTILGDPIVTAANPKQSAGQSGYVYGIPITSVKRFTFGQASWSPSVDSQADQSIYQIGYTWWTYQKVCDNGTYIVYNRKENIHSNYTTRYYDVGLIPYSTSYCPDNSRGTYGNFGNHEYIQSTDNQYPYVELYF